MRSWEKKWRGRGVPNPNLAFHTMVCSQDIFLAIQISVLFIEGVIFLHEQLMNAVLCISQWRHRAC